MKLVRGLQNLVTAAGWAVDGPGPAGRLAERIADARGCVLTVGNYDGVHLGHQQILRVLKQRAAEVGCPSTVLVFEPSSREFIDPAGAPPRLTRWREKYLALAAQKNNCALYMTGVSGDKVLMGRLAAAYKAAGRKLEMGKSCLRFKTLEELPLDVIGDIVASTPVERRIAAEAERRATK